MAIKDDVKRYGWAKSIGARILRRVEQHLGLHIWTIQTRPLKDVFVMPDDHARRYQFRRLTMTEALTAACRPELGMSAEFVEDAFAREDICVGAFADDELVGYVWRTLTIAPVTEDLWIRLERDDLRYGYKSLVLPEHRGQRLNTSIGRFYDHFFIKAGITRDIGYVALHNLASLRATYRDPTREFIGIAGYLNLGSRYFTFRSPAVRAYLSLTTTVKKTAGQIDSRNLR